MTGQLSELPAVVQGLGQTTVVQFRDDIFGPPLSTGQLSSEAKITYGALAQALPLTRRFLAQSPDAMRTWSERLGTDLAEESSLPKLLLSVALRRNAAGPVLFSTTRSQRVGLAAEAAAQGGRLSAADLATVSEFAAAARLADTDDEWNVMIEDLGALNQDIDINGELAVVGAGPAGIVIALEAARHGISVVLLESGDRSYDPAAQELSEAAEWDRRRHAPLSLSTRRQVGGTSNIWGGRCVPFDSVDFESRPYSRCAVLAGQLRGRAELLPAGLRLDGVRPSRLRPIRAFPPAEEHRAGVRR